MDLFANDDQQQNAGNEASNNNESISYKEAISELENLVQNLENEALDVDELSEKVKRAMQLIKACKHKLRSTQDSLNDILDENENDKNTE